MTLLKCEGCGMHRDEVVLDDRELEGMYAGTLIYRAPSESEFEDQVRSFAHVVDELTALGLDKGDLLDVGCNAGYALRAFQERNWSVQGVEQNEATRSYARAKLNASIWEDVASIPSTSMFDVILFSHIIEHIPDPVNFLEPFLKHLREGGIVYVKVPNYGSRIVRYFTRGRWISFLPGQHVWYFHDRGLVVLLARLGFNPVRVYTRGYLSRKSTNPIKALLKLPLVVLQQLTKGDGFEVVGIFKKRPHVRGGWSP